jgi:hypothetical protein
MKALEFSSQLKPDGTISVPAQVAYQLSPGQSLRVLVLVDEEADEDADWRRMAADGFFRDDAEGDAIYDQLPTG